ncbi:AAA family ATPase [Curtobacterium flaccumfaciens]|uniref:ATP-binding protein n=1 Tax=Curtobacterium flaccumfaciens TaxID=2035 RepID=UPI0021C7529C|nr:AAA family ATPase [Curtobacterium flaccumfaciens]UXN23127.1 AAA family ATPase [Curtobacterium flaccumfaciens pv. flaccumfaciens]
MAAVLTDEELFPRGDGVSVPVSAVPSNRLPIRGRSIEQALVADAVAGLARGAGDVLVVRGAAGVGKSRLLEDVVDQATVGGLRVAVGRTDRDARLIPLAPIMDALGAGPRPISDRVRLSAVTLETEARYWLLQQLHDDLERAAASDGVVVVVDDLQWCDTTTLAVLRSLSRRLADVPVLWVVAVRTEHQDPPVTATVDELAATGRVVDLDPLDEQATAAMIADLVGATPDGSVLRAARRTEHIPILVAELVRGLVDEGLLEIVDGVATMPGAAVPASFGASIREGLRRLSKPTQQLVQVGATLGRSFSVRSLSAMLDQPVQRLLPGLQEAFEAGVLVDDGTDLSFRHDVLREAAESMIPAAVRDDLLRQAVDELLRQGVPPVSIAARIATVAQRGDVRAAEVLRTVAIDLASTDAAEAGALALRAADVAHGTPALPGIVVDVLPLLWHSGRTAEARALLDDLQGRLAPEDDARLHLTLARLQTEGSTPEALRTVESALALPGVSAGVRSRLLAVRALNLAQAGQHADLATALRQARATGDGDADPVAVATFEASASVLAFNEGRFADATQAITSAMSRIAATGGSSSTWLPEGLWVAFLAGALGDTDRAGRIAEANAIETRRNHLARPTAAWMMLRTRVLFDQGRLEEPRRRPSRSSTWPRTWSSVSSLRSRPGRSSSARRCCRATAQRPTGRGTSPRPCTPIRPSHAPARGCWRSKRTHTATPGPPSTAARWRGGAWRNRSRRCRARPTSPTTSTWRASRSVGADGTGSSGSNGWHGSGPRRTRTTTCAAGPGCTCTDSSTTPWSTSARRWSGCAGSTADSCWPRRSRTSGAPCDGAPCPRPSRCGGRRPRCSTTPVPCARPNGRGGTCGASA